MPHPGQAPPSRPRSSLRSRPMALSIEQRRRVALFDEMVGVLLDSRFVQRVLGGPVTTRLTWEQDRNGGSMTVDNDGPDDESVRALVLTIRMFIQSRDGISFGEMREIYDDPSVPPDLRSRFHECRDGINEFLDAAPSGVSLNHNGQVLSRREILDVDGVRRALARQPAETRPVRTVARGPALVRSGVGQLHRDAHRALPMRTRHP